MGKQFKMDASTLLIAFSVIFSFSDAQITVGDNDRPNAPSAGDVDSRFFNIDFGNISLGGVAETAIGTTLGQLGTGFLQDCLGIGKRSIIMDRLVNKRSAQEGTGEITDADSRIISPQDVDQRLFCLNNNNGGGGFGGFGGKFFLFILVFSAKRYSIICFNFLFIGSSRPNCRTCSCYNDNRCYNTCDKCYQGYNNYNTGGFSGNSGGSSNFGSSNSNYGNSNSGSGYTNCNSCSCTYSSSCRRSCYKCNNSGGWRRDGTDSSNSGETSSSTTTSDNNGSGAVNFGNA